SHHRLRAPGGRPGTATTSAWCWSRWRPRRARSGYRNRRRKRRGRGASRAAARAEHGASPDLYFQSHAADALVAAAAHRAHRGRGGSSVFGSDRGASVTAMADAFANWLRRQGNVAGIISAGGSGGASLVAPAMRALPVGVPKLIISSVASGDVGPYVGPADI